MTRTRVRRDPHLPAEGDYPTGPIDLHDPSNPEVAAILADVTVDANNAHHSKATGQFVSKRVDYAHLVVHPDQPGIDRPWTWAEVQEVPCGPDAGGPQISVYDWPIHPDVTPVLGKPREWQDEPGVGVDTVVSCCPDCVYGPAPKVEPRKPVAAKGGSRRQCVYVRRSDRTPCPTHTDYTDSKGRPACHQHGGIPR